MLNAEQEASPIRRYLATNHLTTDRAAHEPLHRAPSHAFRRTHVTAIVVAPGLITVGRYPKIAVIIKSKIVRSRERAETVGLSISRVIGTV
jgi:hypothetical protein